MNQTAPAAVLRPACPACLTAKRVATVRASEEPKCSRSGAALLDGAGVEADAQRLEAIVARTDLPVVADFWAPWCGACRAMAPGFAEAARRLAARARFVELNTDEHPDLAARYGIRAVPTLILSRDGREAKRRSGAMAAGSLARWIGT